ncbi:uncharacterized protein RCH25_036328 [Pelodytes ibericus]
MEAVICNLGTALSAEHMAETQQVEQNLASVRHEASSTYLARRRRNNEAARRCRERRRMEEVLLELRALELQRENQRLRTALCALYSGHQTVDWQIAGSPCPGQTITLNTQHIPFRHWDAQARTLRPLCQPLLSSTEPQHCHSTSLCAQHTALSRSPEPSSFSLECGIPPMIEAAHSSHIVIPETPTLTRLPHKLRIKGARALSWSSRVSRVNPEGH